MSGIDDPMVMRGLRWCVNPAFEEYVRVAADSSSVTASDDAVQVDEATYFFPDDSTSDHAGSGETFRGTVSYVAYLGILDVQISAPRLVPDGELTRILIRDMNWSKPRWREFGTLLTANISSGAETDVELSEFGSELFMGRYPVGSTVGRLRLADATEKEEL